MSERRHERVPTLVLLNVESPDTTREAVRAAVVNISKSGAAFEAAAEFSNGVPVILRFTLPEGDIYVFNAVIRRVSRVIGAYEYGVEFLSMDSGAKKNLKKLINKIRKSEKEK